MFGTMRQLIYAVGREDGHKPPKMLVRNNLYSFAHSHGELEGLGGFNKVSSVAVLRNWQVFSFPQKGFFQAPDTSLQQIKVNKVLIEKSKGGKSMHRMSQVS